MLLFFIKVVAYETKFSSSIYNCSAQSRIWYYSRIVLRKVGILILLFKVGILTLRKTISELSLCKVRRGTQYDNKMLARLTNVCSIYWFICLILSFLCMYMYLEFDREEHMIL